ncbi:hypothetical protein EXIGLDRAFT_794508 [Exidia glandulosa HHB12029]|uniref:DUF659 domain-containing protein n=1 Tax=Exidia glandulosa HHB12029 TaxID=1314781 RepID=A0A165NHQ9_EXIGL|nr:hypothetical protein EXIGLDRAFT_794508 [Exidia glandulosa HHB12029]
MTFVSNEDELGMFSNSTTAGAGTYATQDEFLIDFREMTGAHSGENMADLVWKTMQLYGLPGKVIAFMMDNTTDNDTMMASLKRKHRAMSIPFDARMARLRCMPHTIHLAAEKMLQGIGAFKKQQGRTTNYQDDVIPLSAAADDLAEAADEELDNDDLDNMDVDDLIVWVVPKLRRIIRSIRVSPQSRENWLQTATMTLQRRAAEAAARARERAGTESSTASTGATAAGQNPTTAPTPLPAKEARMSERGYILAKRWALSVRKKARRIGRLQDQTKSKVQSGKLRSTYANRKQT